MDSKIRPAVPAMANRMDSPLRTFSTRPRFLASRPVCLNQRSAAKLKSRKMVVTQQPAMKRGLSP